MRRQSLDLIRCPRCRAGSLVPDALTPDDALAFGPARCIGCGALYPVNDGLLDLLGERRNSGPLQQAMEQPWLARLWERGVRGAIDAVLTRGRLSHEREYAAIRALLGTPGGPLLDVGCGAGLVLRKLSREFPHLTIIGMDVSRPMLEEAMAQVREYAQAADFVRAAAPELPFNDASLGAIIAIGFVHFLEDVQGVLAEAARVLKPGGRFIASSWEADAALRIQHGAGLYPRRETELRAAAAAAGLVAFDHQRFGPFLLWKAERP